MRDLADDKQRRFRDYLLKRLRAPAGVVFGHGLVDEAALQQAQGDESSDEVVTRLQSSSLAELEHFFLHFHAGLVEVRAPAALMEVTQKPALHVVTF